MQRTFILFCLGVLILFISGCKTVTKNGDTPVVSVSIVPLEYFIDRLTDGALETNVMIPPGASHATYSPTAAQLQRLSDSQLYVRIGYLGYEQAWMGRLRAMNPNMRLLNLSEGVALIRGEEIDHGDHVHEGGIDPHIWMSPAVMLDLLPTIKTALAETYPWISDRLDANYETLRADVEAIDAALTELSNTLSQKRFMIFHPALTYLARDYGFEQIAVERGGKEPSPAFLRYIIREARAHNIPVIFIQQEFDTRSAQLISEESGAELVQINPLAYDWTASMHELMNVFKTYLK
ncbi:MAG: zinc ABC transporter substrate-binding protein [Bacteroidales bacterium]|nr:zinc ABC transporter substrate-binding protein [Bacteroidales bacterium]